MGNLFDELQVMRMDSVVARVFSSSSRGVDSWFSVTASIQTLGP